MVRIAASFLSAAVVFSSLVSAAPAFNKRQGEIAPIVPATNGGLENIDPNAIPSADPNGSAGNSVNVPTATPSVPTESIPPVATQPPVVETPPAQPPVETPPAQPPVVETPPPSQHTTVIQQQPPVYGSGSVPWHGNYNDCVQTCFAVHPAPPTVVTLPPMEQGQTHVSVPPEHQQGQVSNTETAPQSVPSAGSGEAAPSGNGVTHEIMVEPAAGALNYAPSFVNAAVGDSIRFTVVNGQHSIVQSSPVAPCNATAGGFTSGVQNAGQSFTHVVASTDPIFFFSDVGTDCASGLFGGINAATGNEGSTTTVSALMPKWAAANPDINAALQATEKLAKQTAGMTWGNKIDTAPIPTEFHAALAGSVLYTRAIIGNNPEMVGKDGVFRPTGELVVPNDISALIAVADKGGFPANSPAAAGAGEESYDSAPAAQAAANVQDAPEGAASSLSPRAAIAGVATLAFALFAL